jgi:hypothetical protein
MRRRAFLCIKGEGSKIHYWNLVYSCRNGAATAGHLWMRFWRPSRWNFSMI